MKNRISAEIATAKEAKRLLEFNFKKHLKKVFGIYISGLIYLVTEKKINLNIGLSTRETYLIFRHIDDVLDGDLKLKKNQNPREYILALRGIVAKKQPGGVKTTGKSIQPSPAIVQMFENSLEILEKNASPQDNVRKLFVNAIDAMLYDYDRRQTGLLLNEEEIDAYYYETFAPVLNLMFIGFGSKLRVSPQFLQYLTLAQGHIYSIRDLEKDWNSGIYNIPVEILEKANINKDVSFATLIGNKEIKSWIKREIKNYKDPVLNLKEIIAQSGEAFTKTAVYFTLLDHMLKVLDKLEQDYK